MNPLTEFLRVTVTIDYEQNQVWCAYQAFGDVFIDFGGVTSLNGVLDVL